MREIRGIILTNNNDIKKVEAGRVPDPAARAERRKEAKPALQAQPEQP